MGERRVSRVLRLGFVLLGVQLSVGACRKPTSAPAAPRNQTPSADQASSENQTPRNDDTSRDVPTPTGTGDTASPRPSQTNASSSPLLSVSDRATLSALEAAGYDFRRLALGANDQRNAHTKALQQLPSFQQITRVLRADLKEFQTADPAAGVGMRFAHRLFDAAWLSSEKFQFELVGVVNRLDRRVFAPATCGEVRFLYRLAYRSEVTTSRGSEPVASRVPMTVNVVYSVLREDCRAAAQRWQVDVKDNSGWNNAAHADSAAPDSTQLASVLLSAAGPLGAPARKELTLKTIEVDLQSVRWPSTVRPNMSGHAEYLLRVFAPRDGALEPIALENTPDVALLQRKPALLSELRALLRDQTTLAKINEGTLLLPERFLATRAVSVAPHGLARNANRPYAQLFNPKDWSGVDLGSYATFSTGAALTRRLDALTCTGCHQTKSLAGFHFLGEDDATRRADVIAVPFSAHFAEDRARRADYMTAVLHGQTPDERRPSAEHATERGGYAAHCGLETDGPFGKWTCEAGLICTQLQDADVGQCLPREPELGDACELGHMRPNANAHKDSVALSAPGNCGVGRHCERSGVGFPGGMCSGSCAALPEEGTCGGVAVLTAFNQCLALSQPFEDCILQNTRPGALRSCSVEVPCREDYVCTRLPDGEGACIPPYFLFQLRVDGHVL